jgi:thioredoxin reductase
MYQDQASVAGKTLPVVEHTALLVVGAGPAGVSAAIAAARRGIAVVLVDENPVPFETMAEDIPLHFGQRMGGATRNRNATMETLLEANPALSEAYEAGVDLRLGTAVWGLFVKAPTVAWLPHAVAGLADHERSWLLSFNQAIIASGGRDMGLAFPGWELPGVMGATAAVRLADTYKSLEARRAVVLGSGASALQAVEALRRAGVEVPAVVECAERAVGPPDRISDLAAAGVPLLTGHVVKVAEGDIDGLKSVTVTAVDSGGRHVPETEQRFTCDTVINGIGHIPSIELFEALGCTIVYSPERGGHVPLLDGYQRTSIPFIHAVGDCAGIWPEKTHSPEMVQAEALVAVGSVSDSLGLTSNTAPVVVTPPDLPAMSLEDYRCAWVRASVVGAAGEPHVCQCEAVTAREIMEVRPPRYLAWEDSAQKPRDLPSLLGTAVPNPDLIKRLTRAGMGLCQGRRCREQTAALLALSAGTPLSEIPLATFRAPVRPLPLALLAEGADSEGINAHWDSWFAMAAQWEPFWRVPATYTAAGRDLSSAVASE